MKTPRTGIHFRNLPSLLGTVVIALAAVTAANHHVAAQPVSGKTTVTIAQGTDARNLDPARETTVSAISTMSNIYDTLIWRTGDGKLAPALAESWQFDDPKTLTLTLRRNVTFHNGDLLTAQDVAFSLKRYIDVKAQYEILTQVNGLYEDVEVVDDYTVRIRLPGPRATMLANLVRLPILPKKAFEAMGEAKFGQTPIGTGPYKLVEWKRNQQVVLEAFDNHWRGRPQIDRQVVRPIPEDFARFTALKTGEVDIIVNVAAERVKDIESQADLKIASVRSMRTYFVTMNIFQKPFSDKRVREALNHAVDVQSIVDTVLGGRSYINPSACAGLSDGHDDSIKPYAYDPELAKKMLAEAGFPNGFTTEMWGPVGRYPKDKEVQEAIAGQLAQVGVTVKHIQPEWAEFLRKFLGGDIKSITFMAVGNPSADCDYAMGQRVDSTRGGRFYHTPKVDALIATEREELDPAKRNAIFAEIQKQMLDDAAWIFLYDAQDIYGVNARFAWKPRPDETIWAYDIAIRK